MTSRKLLSLCMIVRDAERTLEACLSSIKPWVDEMVVVDTGSVDRTRQIATDFGARLFEFPWCDDFAAARNESLRHAEGEWIFWMDADDTIDEENGRQLQELANQAADASTLGYVMQIVCPGPDGETAGGTTVVDHIKMFRNREDLRFEGRIHEQILGSIRAAGGEVVRTGIRLVHSGHDHSREGQAKKFERDLRLLKLDAAERPNHPFVLFNLGMTYLNHGDVTEAVEALKQCVLCSTPQESHTRKAYALLVSALSQCGEGKMANAVCQTGRALFRDDKELLYREGLLYQSQGRPEQAVQAFQQLLDDPTGDYFSSFDRSIVGFRGRYCLAQSLTELGRLNDAERQFQAVVADRPDFAPAWSDLGAILLRQGKPDEAERLADTMIARDGLRFRGAALKSQAHETRGDRSEARDVLEDMVARFPGEVEPLDNLCQFLFQNGPLEDAKDALERLIAARPDDGSACHNLATVNLRLKQPVEASVAFRESVRLRPDAPHSWYQLAELLDQLGDTEGAAEARKQVVRLAPDSKWAHAAQM